jgi:hypothetical protein
MADPPVLRWLHRSEIPLGEAVASGMARAKSGFSGPLDTSSARGEFRGFLVGMLHAMALAGSEPPRQQGEDTIITIRPSARTDDKEWQGAFLRGVSALATGGKARTVAELPKVEGTKTYATKGGDAGEAPIAPNPNVAAFAFWGFAAVVTCAGILSTLVYGLVSQTNELEYTKIATDQNQKQLVTLMSEARDVFTKHKEEEASKGTSIAYSQAELQYLEALNAGIKVTAEKAPKIEPPKTLPPVKEIGANLGEGLKSGFNWGLAIVGLTLGYLIVKN